MGRSQTHKRLGMGFTIWQTGSDRPMQQASQWYKSTMSFVTPSRRRVLHFPDWREGSRYQPMLAAGLAECGYDIRFANYAGATLPLFRNVRRHRADALHIHWIADIQGARERNSYKHLLKQLVFRLDVSLVHRLLDG